MWWCGYGLTRCERVLFILVETNELRTDVCAPAPAPGSGDSEASAAAVRRDGVVALGGFLIRCARAMYLRERCAALRARRK